MSVRYFVIALACVAAPAIALAQGSSAPPPSSSRAHDAAQKARYQLRVMEGVLENAVQHGIRSIGQQLQAVSPDVIFFGAPSRARGFRLDGFGVFFDVDVPLLRPSMVWSSNLLTQSGPEVARGASLLKKLVGQQADAGARRDLEQVLRMVEAQAAAMGGIGAATVGAGDPIGGSVSAGPQPVDLPSLYETEVKRALADAMLDYGTTLNVGDQDVLAVAARSNEDVLSGGAYDVVTVMMTLRGSDLSALRTGAASRDDVRRRIVVLEY